MYGAVLGGTVRTRCRSQAQAGAVVAGHGGGDAVSEACCSRAPSVPRDPARWERMAAGVCGVGGRWTLVWAVMRAAAEGVGGVLVRWCSRAPGLQSPCRGGRNACPVRQAGRCPGCSEASSPRACWHRHASP